MAKYLAALLLTCLCLTTRAQTWEIGGNFGGAGYMGDLNQHNPFKFSGLGGVVFVKRNFNPYWGVKVGFNHGMVQGADSLSNDPSQYNRNLSFKTSMTEVSLMGEFNFMEYVPSVSKNMFTPYFFAGVALTEYTPKATYQGQSYELRLLETEGKAYKGSTIAAPFGIGIKYNVAGRVSLGLELGYRVAFTDYLDDVSGLYADKATLSSPLSVALSDRSRVGSGVAGTQRGDLRPRDTYMFAGFTISYTFISQKCYY
jgi:hypothetical protein